MSEATALVCNRQKRIVFIIEDNLCLFPDDSQKVFENIIAEKSKFQLPQFFSTVEEHIVAFNWQIKINPYGQVSELYFSGIFWAGMYIINISKSKLAVTLSPIYTKPTQKAFALYSSILEKQTAKLQKSGSDANLQNQRNLVNCEAIELLSKQLMEFTEIDIHTEKLEQLAATDSLTGLLNRTAIINYAKAELIGAGQEQKLFGLAIIEIDKLKQINNCFGSQVGDKTLKRFAYCLTKSTREYDAVGRIGDNEFLIFFKINTIADFEKLIERLLENFRKNEIAMSNGIAEQINATTSAIYFFPHTSPGIEIADVMKYAYVELNKAKQKNGVHLVITKFSSKSFVTQE